MGGQDLCISKGMSHPAVQTDRLDAAGCSVNSAEMVDWRLNRRHMSSRAPCQAAQTWRKLRLDLPLLLPLPLSGSAHGSAWSGRHSGFDGWMDLVTVYRAPEGLQVAASGRHQSAAQQMGILHESVICVPTCTTAAACWMLFWPHLLRSPCDRPALCNNPSLKTALRVALHRRQPCLTT